MHTMFITLLFDERATQALCLTLVHSLWQGLLLAIVTGILILLTRRSGPLVRYGLFSAVLVLFCLGAVTTFILQWDHAAGTVAPVAPTVFVHAEDRSSMSAVTEATPSHETVLPGYRNVVESVAAFFNEHAFLIVAIWFVLLSVKMARVTVQLGTHRRLRHHAVHVPPAAWQDRVRELALRLGINVPVRLLESEIVPVPTMIGFLKPVILLPLSLLSQLPAAEVEAILLHELAHIRRGDYVVNVIFTFWETLFFFNPAVLWICALIREERENCCDDIAVRQTGNKKEFISALVSFVQADRKAGACAMSFPGSGNHLLQRVRRIVYRDDKRLDGKEKFFLVFCFVLAGMLTLAYTHASPEHKTSSYVWTTVLINDSVPVEHAGERDNKDLDERVVAASDSANVGAAKAQRKQEKIMVKDEIKEKKELKEKIKEMKEGKEKEDMKERDEIQEMREQLEKQELKERQEISEMKERAESPEVKEQLEKMDARERAEKLEMKKLLDILKMKADVEKGKVDEQQRTESKGIEYSLDKFKQAELDDPNNKEELEVQIRKLLYFQDQMKRNEERRGLVDSLAKKQGDHYARVDQKIILSIIDGLVGERLIDDRDGAFSFSLDNDALIVNGVRQSEELHKRFEQKFLGGPKNRVTFSRDKDKKEHTSVSITTD